MGFSNFIDSHVFCLFTGRPIQAQGEFAVVDKNFSVYANVISTDNDRKN